MSLQASRPVELEAMQLLTSPGCSSILTKFSSSQGPVMALLSACQGECHVPVQGRPSLRPFAQCHESLTTAYNECVQELLAFRNQHKGFASSYIAQHSKVEQTGTGGSDFMPALRGYAKTTSHHALS